MAASYKRDPNCFLDYGFGQKGLGMYLYFKPTMEILFFMPDRDSKKATIIKPVKK